MILSSGADGVIDASLCLTLAVPEFAEDITILAPVIDCGTM